MRIVLIFLSGVVTGLGLMGAYTKHERDQVVSKVVHVFKEANPKNPVVVKGEKGRNGGGDAGDGLFWDCGMAILPGSAAQ